MGVLGWERQSCGWEITQGLWAELGAGGGGLHCSGAVLPGLDPGSRAWAFKLENIKPKA